MKNIRARMGIDTATDRGAESGVTLVEVIVAMVIFAMVSTGILAGMLTVLGITRDARATQVATNLASEEIDLVRSVDDIFDLEGATRTVSLNGDTFTIIRTADWVSDPDLDLSCGAGGGILRYKRVQVRVEWENMQSPDAAVESYTVIDPNERINDPAKGTILVSVLGASGTGSSGVSVSASPASPANGAAALTEAPAATDGQGCTYILKVVPGNYTVTVSRSNYVDELQASTASKVVGVAAGAAATVSFAYDRAGSVTVNYASNSPVPNVKIPTNMATSFLSTYGTYVSTVTNSSSLSRTLNLHPFSAGYEVLAGKYVAPTDSSAGCPAVDPSAWPEGTDGSDTIVGVRQAAVATTPGGSASTPVNMGVFTMTGGSDRYVKAVSVDGTPRCQASMTYVFGQVLPSNSSQTVNLALPYGTWDIYVGGSSSQNNIPGLGRITMATRGSVGLLGLSNRITLDPREVAP